MKIASCIVLSMLITSCNRSASYKADHFKNRQRTSCNYETIGEIRVPAGYKRVAEEKNSFGEWLRRIDLKKDPRIYLYNGTPKDDKWPHFFFSRSNIDSIRFKATDGTELCFLTSG